MNRKDELKIGLISSIDDEIIETQTKKRIRLLRKNRYSRKKLIGWSGAAACLLLSLSALFIMLIPMRQVPVYEGMTVSNSDPSEQLLWSAPEVGARAALLSASKHQASGEILGGTRAELLQSNERETTDKPEKKPPHGNRLEQSLVEGTNRTLYYAKQNEDIYITIHLNNPSAFEILSFTLNGTKYQSYMFEKGSDSEALILKVNVGDAQGVVEYTIDAIKYVDGDEIKNVRMDGDKVVRVGVCPQEQPTVTVTDWEIDYKAIGFRAALSDSLELIELSGGSLWAYLYDGELAVASQELSARNTQGAGVRFSELVPGKEYRCEIVAHYDALDGEGFGSYLLYQKNIRAKSHVRITNVQKTDHVNLGFDVVAEEGFAGEIQRVELLDSLGHTVKTGDANTRSFLELSLGSYTVRVTYAYGEANAEVGYAYAQDPVVIDSFGSITRILKTGTISRGYNEELQVYFPTTEDYRVHLGVDLVATDSNETAVFAAFGGIVSEVSVGTVVITLPDNAIELIYRNLGEISVKAGDAVVAGQQLGVVGATLETEAAEPPHVHIELRIQGEAKDPMTYFEKEPPADRLP
ncbi:MAG: M23 family metallopeptidase [Ruminococcaceae bacterium]|nr:M23 family metallopeptidase [Oscillospiraceae bacterium]